MRVLVAGGVARSLLNFRAPLLRALADAGHSVVTTAAEPAPEVAAKLEAWGITYRPVSLSRAAINPRLDWEYMTGIARLIDAEQIDAVLCYTHKPVVFSALAAARSHRRPRVYPIITGLGYAFIGRGPKASFARVVLCMLYRRAAKFFSGVIFQNPDDQALFRKLKLVRPETPQIIVRGSGIDLEQFAYEPLHELRNDDTLKTEKQKRSVRFLLIARLLGDKGIREYVEAARIIKTQYAHAEFHLVGPTDPNPAAIKLSEVEAWQREGVIAYHGKQSDVRSFLGDCTVYVLPSYREGTPRTVLEAMAIGRPVITTDTPGCRETVFFGTAEKLKPETLRDGINEGVNGFLVPVKSVDGLVAAMNRFIDDPTLAAKMGAEGRRLADEYYDVHKVNRQIMTFMGLPSKSGE